MATLRTRYVNTDSTAGGDGTTNATSGANRAYATLNDCEIAEQGDLVSQDVQLDIYCTAPSGVHDNVKVDFHNANWTADATRYIRIIGEITGPKYDVAKYRLVGATADWALIVRIPYTRIIALQVKPLSGDIGIYTYCTSGIIYVERCVALCEFGDEEAFRVGDNGHAVYVSNCVAYGPALHHFNVEGSGGLHRIYNCTSAGVGSGNYAFRNQTPADVVAKNCLVDTGGAFGFCFNNNGGGSWIGDYCASNSPNDPHPGANSKSGTRPTFVDYATGDVHLDAGDTWAKDEGVDLSSDPDYPFSIDIDGVTRTGAWDIGADEVPGGGATLDQSGYQFLEDDAGEGANTPLAAENTPVTLEPGVPVRLRIQVDVTGDPASKNFVLKYKRSTDSLYKKINLP